MKHYEFDGAFAILGLIVGFLVVMTSGILARGG